MCGVLYWNDIKDTCQSWAALRRAERLFRWRYRMISFTSSMVMQLYHFTTEFDHLMMQLVGNVILQTICLNTEQTIGSWYSSSNHLNCWWKAVQNLIFFIRQYLMCNSHVHLKKWTIKFKLMYLLNHNSCLNKICRMCCVNTHI